MKVFIFALAFGLMWAVTPMRTVDLARAQGRQAERKAARYACPMHPEVRSSKPGKCPKCGMALRLVKDPSDAPASPAIGTAPKDATDSFAFSSSRIPDVKIY